MKFALLNIKYQILRNLSRSVINIIAYFVILCCMIIYLGAIISSDENIDKLADVTPVAGEIVNPNGANSFGISINNTLFNNIMSMDIRDEKYSALLAGVHNVGAEYHDLEFLHDLYIYSANTVDGFNGISFSDELSEDFLASSENICMLQEEYMTSFSLEISDSIEFVLYTSEYDRTISWWRYTEIGRINLEIVGSFTGDINNSYINLIAPMNFIENTVTDAGEKLTYNSFSFTVGNPLELNSFKESLLDNNFGVVNYSSEDPFSGRAIRMNDKLYIENAEQLIELDNTLQMFLVPFFALIIALVIILSFLILRNERYNIAVSCSLGYSKKQKGVTVFCGSLILTLVSILLAIPFNLLFVGLNIIDIGIIFSLFTACVCIGNIIAIKLILSFDIMKMLITE